MRKPGSIRSRPKHSPNAVVVGLVAALVSGGADQGPLHPYVFIGDSIPSSLTGVDGDPVGGQAIVLDRRLGACVLCHAGPFPDEKFQGALAPNLSGVGSRWSAGQLRLRLVDATRLNPDTIMPAYYRVDGFVRVGQAWRGRPILTAEQIEDVVAFPLTLRD